MSDRTRILVVDDEEIVCLSVQRILAREGLEVDMATNAQAALAKAAERQYNLVITDLMMPELNGIELMHALREKGLDAPFLMITGYPTIKTAIQALRLGAIDYVPKPFTRQELLGPVNRALRRDPHGPAEEPAPSNTAPALPGDRFVLPEHSWAVYGQDGTIAVGIEESFLKTAGPVTRIMAPGVNEMVEQGYPAVRLGTADGGEHGVFMPFTGQVLAVNPEALARPGEITAAAWIVQVIPSNLASDVSMLIKKEAPKRPP
jgi:CheY-like chemotaxis protein